MPVDKRYPIMNIAADSDRMPVDKRHPIMSIAADSDRWNELESQMIHEQSPENFQRALAGMDGLSPMVNNSEIDSRMAAYGFDDAGNQAFQRQHLEASAARAPKNIGSNITGSGPTVGQFLQSNAGRDVGISKSETDVSANIPGIDGANTGEATLEAILKSVLSSAQQVNKPAGPVLSPPTPVPAAIGAAPGGGMGIGGISGIESKPAGMKPVTIESVKNYLSPVSGLGGLASMLGQVKPKKDGFG